MMRLLRRAECGISAKLLLLVILGLVASPAFAGTVIASGAGSLPGSAQDLTGAGVVTDIQGSLDLLDGLYVSMFAIDITDYQGFSAQTLDVGAFGLADTELFLFDSSGDGIYMNDDISGSNTLSCLPSATSNPCPTGNGGLGPTSDGVYYLAIAESADLPWDASDTYLFLSGSSTDVLGPDSSAGAIDGWDGGVYASPDYDLNNYDIQLTGVGAAPAPEPAPWLLLLSALACTWIFRSFARFIPVKVRSSN
ncbi:MAG: hypothetical protein P4K93_02400 [Terracidiphilus sp.]|nr:hypothetical protein [Terracidiphilus sp.]MDR3796973.1 hypothetical protein [Terracidiphilus sp.]